MRGVLLSGFMQLVIGAATFAQTLAPSVRSAALDPASLGSYMISDGSRESGVGYVQPASANAVAHASDALSLPTSEGTIISVTEGEDKIIGTSDAVPPGFPTSTNAQYGMGYSGGTMPGYTPPGAAYGAGSYGYGGAYSGNAPYGSPMGNPCCPENCHDYYVGFESVFLRRKTDEGFSLSQGNFVRENFDFEFGGRYTIGQMLDCTDGVELVYTGPFNWRRGQTFQATTAPLTSILRADGGYVNGQLFTFNNALRHIQFEEIDLQSYEANRRWFAWDIMSTLIGLRALNYNESLLFDAITPSPDFFAGFYRQRMENFLLGAQIGADVMRPIGQRLSVGSKTRLGIFANFNKGETIVANAGDVLINSSRRDTDIAGLIQTGTSARYQVTKCISAVAGYEAWILAGVATNSDQIHTPITPVTGTTYRTRDLVFFHGATGGIEIKF